GDRDLDGVDGRPGRDQHRLRRRHATGDWNSATADLVRWVRSGDQHGGVRLVGEFRPARAGGDRRATVAGTGTGRQVVAVANAGAIPDAIPTEIVSVHTQCDHEFDGPRTQTDG